MSFVSEFKEFAVKGNMMDLAIGVIFGGAFGKIIDSLVTDLIAPPLSFLTGKGFVDNFIVLKPAATGEANFATLAAAKEAGAVVLSYGNFITVVMNFIILAFVIFMLVKVMNKLRKQQEEAPAAPPAQEVLLTEIRDLLKKN